MLRFRKAKEASEDMIHPKHAPGPWWCQDKENPFRFVDHDGWEVSRDRDFRQNNCQSSIAIRGEYEVIALAVMDADLLDSHEDSVLEANARLIAAAPDLYEQLQIACQKLQEIGMEHQIAEIPELVGIREALRKAA